MLVLNWKGRSKENLVVSNKDDIMFLSQNYRFDCCPMKIG